MRGSAPSSWRSIQACAAVLASGLLVWALTHLWRVWPRPAGNRAAIPEGAPADVSRLSGYTNRQLLDHLRAASRAGQSGPVQPVLTEFRNRGAAPVDEALSDLLASDHAYESEPTYWLALTSVLKSGLTRDHVARIETEVLKLGRSRETTTQAAAHADVPGRGLASLHVSVLGALLCALAERGDESVVLDSFRRMFAGATRLDLRADLIRTLRLFPARSPGLRALLSDVLAVATEDQARAAAVHVLACLGDGSLLPEIAAPAEEAFRRAAVSPKPKIPLEYVEAMVKALGFRDTLWLVLTWVADGESPTFPLHLSVGLAPSVLAEPNHAEALMDMMALARTPMQIACVLATLDRAVANDARVLEHARHALRTETSPLVQREAVLLLRRQTDPDAFLAALIPALSADDKGVRGNAVLCLADYAYQQPDSASVVKYASDVVAHGADDVAVLLIEAMTVAMSVKGRAPVYVDLLKSQVAGGRSPAVKKAAGEALQHMSKRR